MVKRAREPSVISAKLSYVTHESALPHMLAHALCRMLIVLNAKEEFGTMVRNLNIYKIIVRLS